jgi:choline/glycine/proline betaine transport protein
VKVHPIVFPVSAIVIVAFVLAGVLLPQPMGDALETAQGFVTETVGWFYILAVGAFLLFAIYLFFSRFGDIKLGKDDDEPDFSYPTWFAMLFSAGMGIGLMFWSVAEPMWHFTNPHRGAEALTDAAAREAMVTTFFHWGLHAWAIYIVVALALAYYAFRHGLPLSLRSALYPLIGKRVHGAIGNVVDILAVFGTLFGLATSLGLGVLQINAGLDFLGAMPNNTTNQVILIAAITFAATISVVTGLDKGIRRLSELNLVLAITLLVFVLAAGPTLLLVRAFVQNLGAYGSSLVELTFTTDALRGVDWQKDWTMFYWAWWISWSPFVGMFIARVSKGRTIREFVGGVLLVPSLLTFLWLTVFGNTGLDIAATAAVAGDAQAAGQQLIAADTETMIFTMLQGLPLSSITAALTVAVITIFFITSSDSGSLVVDMITSGGDPNPPVAQRVFWALTEGAVAAVLLIAGANAVAGKGDQGVALGALQDAAIITALPLSFILLITCVGLVKGLSAERRTMDPLTRMSSARHQRHASRVDAAASNDTEPERRDDHVPVGSDPAAPRNGRPWRQRLDALTSHISEHRRLERSPQAAQRTIERFFQSTVKPAFDDIRTELEKNARSADITIGDREAVLVVIHDGAEEFSYGIQAHVNRRKARVAFPEQPDDDDDRGEHRAEVVLRSGRQKDRRLREWSREMIAEDFTREYARWMGW